MRLNCPDDDDDDDDDHHQDDDDAAAKGKPQMWKPRNPLFFVFVLLKRILRHARKPSHFSLVHLYRLLVEDEPQTEKHFEMSFSLWSNSHFFQASNRECFGFKAQLLAKS